MNIRPINSVSFGMAMVLSENFQQDIVDTIGKGEIKNITREVKDLNKIKTNMQKLIPATNSARVDVVTSIADGKIQGDIFDHSGENVGVIEQPIKSNKSLKYNFDKYTKSVGNKMKEMTAAAQRQNANEINDGFPNISPKTSIGAFASMVRPEAEETPEAPDTREETDFPE